MILFVTERREYHLESLRRLIAEGIFLYHCPFRTSVALCRKKEIGGVVIDCVGEMPKAELLCEKLRREQPDEMPIAAIVTPNSIPCLAIDRVIRDHGGDLFDDLLDFCITNCGWSTEALSTFRLRAGKNPAENLYMGQPFPLPPRAHTILRCLFYRAPALTSTKDLLHLCYPEGTQLADNLAIQIRNINLLAKRISPEPLIVNEYARGYRLRDGILN
ncbi:MAG: helix-turn-helix domain-containing protein [Clostridia bacterium]|nr:helix-turn-helix domain-containing protein [Clostridia bacterium]